MRRAFVFVLAASAWSLLLPCGSIASDLHGRIVNMETTPPVAVPSARVRMQIIKKETVTNSHGEFTLDLGTLAAGEQVDLSVDAAMDGKQLLFFQPLDGKIRIPKDPANEMVVIGLLPKGSLRFYNDEAIEALLKQANSEGQKKGMQAVRGAPVAQFDLEYLLEQWGKGRGLDPGEVGKRVSAWAENIRRKPTANMEEKGLAAFARRNFDEAGRLFAEAGDTRLKRLKEMHTQEEEERRLVVEDYRQSGDAQFNGAFYGRALEEYRKAMAASDRELCPSEWARLKVLEANVHTRLGETQEGSEAVTSLRSAISEFQEGLVILTQEKHAADWAVTQNNLGIALRALGERGEREESLKLLGQAVEAYRNALQVFTREQFPGQEAVVQNNLHRALQELSALNATN